MISGTGALFIRPVAKVRPCVGAKFLKMRKPQCKAKRGGAVRWIRNGSRTCYCRAGPTPGAIKQLHSSSPSRHQWRFGNGRMPSHRIEHA